MMWSLSPIYFCKVTLTFVNFLRAPDPEHLIAPQNSCMKTYLRLTRWRGSRILPYFDDFLLFASREEEAFILRQRLAQPLDPLGLLRHPTKGLWTLAQVGHHLGIDINTTSGYFYAPEAKLNKIAQHARHLIGRATRSARWLPVKDLQSLACQALHLFSAIPAARFFLREVHSAVSEKWGGLVRLNPQATTRHAVVERGSPSVQRKAHSQTRLDRVSTNGHLRLSMRCGTKRAPRSSKIMEQRGRTEAHQMGGFEGRPSRCREFLTTVGRPQRPHARGQLGSLSHSDRSDLTITCHDRGTTTPMLLTRHEQHQPHGTLHQISGQRLGRQAQSTPRQRRLETRPGTFCGTLSEVRSALD
jgi:hypothetical protein